MKAVTAIDFVTKESVPCYTVQIIDKFSGDWITVTVTTFKAKADKTAIGWTKFKGDASMVRVLVA